jgi:hypothetical protein
MQVILDAENDPPTIVWKETEFSVPQVLKPGSATPWLGLEMDSLPEPSVKSGALQTSSFWT